jgi:predicted ATP-grasp superfamily ATP-dependent carboligase
VKKTNGKIDFIVFGEGNYHTLGVLHCMASKGIDVYLLLVGSGKRLLEADIVEFSKYARYGHCVQTKEEGLEWLLEHQSDFPKGTVLFPTSDWMENLLDIHYDALIHHYVFPNCGKQGEVTRLMDKNLQNIIAEQHGIRTLRSVYASDIACNLDEVVYPCMVKPLVSVNGSKGDMCVCGNRQELDDALASAKHTKEFIIQQYIQNESDLLLIGISLPNGDVWTPSLVVKPEVSSTGEYTYANVTTDVEKYLPELSKVKEFVKSLNYYGPFSVEFGVEKGKNYFFEMNLRNDGTSHYPLASGVNIAYVYYRACKGELIQEDMHYEEGDFPMIDEVLDIRRVLYGELSLSQWFQFLRKAKGYQHYVPFDKRIAVVLIPFFVSRMCSKIWRSIRAKF